VAAQASKGHTGTPAARSRTSDAIPRSDPVPTEPAPPIWKMLLGRGWPGWVSASVRRKGGRDGSAAGRAWPGRPQNGGGHAASHAGPIRAASSHPSGPTPHPCERANQAGKPKLKSIPTAMPAWRSNRARR